MVRARWAFSVLRVTEFLPPSPSLPFLPSSFAYGWLETQSWDHVRWGAMGAKFEVFYPTCMVRECWAFSVLRVNEFLPPSPSLPFLPSFFAYSRLETQSRVLVRWGATGVKGSLPPSPSLPFLPSSFAYGRLETQSRELDGGLRGLEGL